MPLGEGAQFAGYTVVRLLGIGGMGEVYVLPQRRVPSSTGPTPRSGP
jgi:hypothetical protein